MYVALSTISSIFYFIWLWWLWPRQIHICGCNFSVLRRNDDCWDWRRWRAWDKEGGVQPVLQSNMNQTWMMIKHRTRELENYCKHTVCSALLASGITNFQSQLSSSNPFDMFWVVSGPGTGAHYSPSLSNISVRYLTIWGMGGHPLVKPSWPPIVVSLLRLLSVSGGAGSPGSVFLSKILTHLVNCLWLCN